MFDDLLQQLNENCTCLSDDDIEADDFKKNVEQLINLLSILTCWKRGTEPCETFLLSERKEIFTIGQLQQCGCCDNYLMDVPLTYDKIDPSTIKIVFQVRDGIHFNLIEINSNDFSYDETENRVWIDFSNYEEAKKCGCEKMTKIIITYDAGYEKIPECLLPVFCDYLGYVIDMNRCKCGCPVCDTTETVTEDNILNADSSDAQVSTYLVVRQHIITAYARQLESISICGRDYTYWGAVV